MKAFFHKLFGRRTITKESVRARLAEVNTIRIEQVLWRVH